MLRMICRNVKLIIVEIYNKILFKAYFFAHSGLLRKPLHCQGIKFLHIGSNVTIDKGSRIDCYKNNDFIPNLSIGSNTMISYNFTCLCSTELKIEENVLIASNVLITTENHGNIPGDISYLNQKLISKPILIKRNAWIGEKTVILPGLTIGEWSIVGANSVVTKSIPAYSIAVGNPAKVIKQFDFNTNKWVAIKDEIKDK